jgi:ZIP family zinc transporter
VTIHNIPEGLAVGLAFGAAAVSGEPGAYYAALGLAIGMAIQNFPEGAAIALPMKVATRSKRKAFLFGMGSGAVEPIAAVVGYVLASEVAVLHPWMLGFAAGAMIFVVAEDLIPDSNINEYPHAGTWGVMLGFVLMMVLDVALG